MITLEQAQIFFYTSVPICLIIATLIFVITKIVVATGVTKILNKILKGIKEIEEKVQLFKLIVKEVKEKFMDLKFYMDKAEAFKDQINELKEDLEETFEEEIKPKRKTTKRKTKKSSK